jgi:hypothetical protein
MSTRPRLGAFGQAHGVGESAMATPGLGVNRAGDQVLAWTGRDGIVRASVRMVGGDWSPPEELGEGGRGEAAPSAVIDPRGVAMVAWTGSDFPANPTPGQRLSPRSWSMLAVRTPGGSFRARQVAEPGFSTRLVMDDAGNALLLWRRSRLPEPGLSVAYRPAGQDFYDPEFLAIPSGGAAGFDGRGWPTVAGGSPQEVAVTTRVPGHGWTHPEQVPGSGGTLTLAVAPSGEVLVGWGSFGAPGSTGARPPTVTIRPPGGVFGEPTQLEQAYARVLQSGYDAYGNALLVWERMGGGIFAVEKPAGGGLGRVRQIAPAGTTSPSLDVGADGAAVVAFNSGQSGPPGEARIHATVREDVPDVTPPGLVLTGPARQRVTRKRAPIVYARCSEACSLAYSLRLRVRGKRKKLTASARQPQRARARRALRLRFKARAGRRLRATLARRGRLRATAVVEAYDAVGNRSRKKKALILRR